MIDPAFEAWIAKAREVTITQALDIAAPGHAARLKRQSRELVGPCPACGGRDRFAISLPKNVSSCRGCGGADAIGLVEKVRGVEFLAAVELITGEPPPRGKALTAEERARIEAEEAERRARLKEEEARKAAEQERYREAERVRCREAWDGAVPAIGSPVEAYFRHRGLLLPVDAELRYAPVRGYFEGEEEDPVTGRKSPRCIWRGPAMLAAIRRADGRFGGLHTTWIDPRFATGEAVTGNAKGKARIVDPATGEVLPAKKSRGSVHGGFIVLQPSRAPRQLIAGEGIETACAVLTALQRVGRDLSGTAVWSSVDLGNLGGKAMASVAHPTLLTPKGRPQRVPGPEPDLRAPAMPVPDSVTDFVPLGDGDSDPFTTRLALERACRRNARRGRTCRPAFAPEGTDFNDLMMGEG